MQFEFENKRKIMQKALLKCFDWCVGRVIPTVILPGNAPLWVKEERR
jgi:hypothetical protein